ncbi:MAG: hypothetical protein ACOYI3_02210 [Christensenellales bacterium]
MVTFIVVLIFVLVILLDFIPKRKEWEKSECVVYIILLGIGFMGMMLHSFHIEVPSVAGGITSIVTAIFPNAQ